MFTLVFVSVSCQKSFTGSSTFGAPPPDTSLLEFYDHVMTFYEEAVDLMCCKVDGTPISVSCGQGLSCANACYAKEAVLCPSHNCEDCNNWDHFDGASRKGSFSWSTQFSSMMRSCLNNCPVGKRKHCCFHPSCRKRENLKRRCSFFQYFVGKPQ